MDINKHNESQKQIREMEWNTRTAKHARMRELRKAYLTEKEAGRVETTTVSEQNGEFSYESNLIDTILNYHESHEYDVMLARRAEVAKQKFHCPVCGTDQIQLVNWYNQVVDLRCRRCKRKFIWESPV